MSDAAITTLASAAITIMTMVVGLLTLWVKVKYGVDEAKRAASNAETAATVAAEKANVVEGKIDANTVLTTAAKVAAEKTEKQTNGALASYDDRLDDHRDRISALEAKVEAIRASVDVVTKNIDSTRHEMRGHLQGIMNKLDLMASKSAPVTGSK